MYAFTFSLFYLVENVAGTLLEDARILYRAIRQNVSLLLLWSGDCERERVSGIWGGRRKVVVVVVGRRAYCR